MIHGYGGWILGGIICPFRRPNQPSWLGCWDLCGAAGMAVCLRAHGPITAEKNVQPQFRNNVNRYLMK